MALVMNFSNLNDGDFLVTSACMVLKILRFMECDLEKIWQTVT